MAGEADQDGLDRIQIKDPHAVISIPGSKLMASRTDPFSGELSIKKANEIPLPNSWDQIPAIHLTRGIQIEKSEDLIFVVELPLYKAVRTLYDAHIQTTESNAHFEPHENETTIGLGIVWDSLNSAQQRYAMELCRQEPDKWKHLSKEEHPDGYEALYLDWRIHRKQVTPRMVKGYADSKAENLTRRLVVKPFSR